jgi:predicted DNA binding CopG/RHH family protein
MKKIPKFSSEQEEREFWESHDSMDYVDWSKAQRVVLSNLKPSTTSISIRLSNIMLEEIKQTANKSDIPYQSFIKVLIDFGLRNFNPPKRGRLARKAA